MRFLNEVGRAELVLAKRVDIGNRFAASGFADEFDLVALNVLDAEDVELGEKVQRQIVDGVAEDGFLDEEHVAFSCVMLAERIHRAIYSPFLIFLTMLRMYVRSSLRILSICR